MQNNTTQYLVNSFLEKNDEQAFNELFRLYFPGLVSFAGSIVKNPEAVEDIVEDVFVKLWENRALLPTINNLSHYIYVATKHACFNYLKDKRNAGYDELGDDLLFSGTNPESEMVHKENSEAIISLINQLPAKCRLIFRLVKDEGMKYSEVAQLLDISVRTVNAQMTIAIARIADGLQKTLPEYTTYFKRRSL